MINELNEKVWAGNDNCEEVTWEDCTLEDREITQEVEVWKCTQATQPISYQVAAVGNVDVTPTTENVRQELTLCAATQQRSSARPWSGRIAQTKSLPTVSQHISRFLTKSMTTGSGALLDIKQSETFNMLPPFRLYISINISIIIILSPTK